MPDEELIDYIDQPLVYLEVADRRTVLEPYGPRYPKAVGRIYRLVPGGAPPIGDSEADIAFVDELVLPSEKVGQTVLFDKDLCGETIPVRINFRARSIPTYHAELLMARVNYDWPNRIPDLKGLNDRQVALWVIRESMERFTLEYYNRGLKTVPH